MTRRTTGVVFGAAAVLMLPAAMLAKDPELPSAWRTSDVFVDGVADEWAGKLVPLAGIPVSIGVQNDASFLYVCMKTTDAATKKQILAVGLSFYLDGSGKQDRSFGVRFPLRTFEEEQPYVPDSGDPSFSHKLDLSVARARLEVLGREESDTSVMRVSDARPIEAALDEQEGALVVELKVPLAFSLETPLSIGTAPGGSIALGLETTEHKVKKMKRAPDEDAGISGGGGFSRRGMGRGRGGRPSKGERDVARSYGKPLKAWLAVPLASPPKP